jgi:nucleoside-diphosphate-sugar epimerase
MSGIILLTGATGFIGKSFLENALNNGWSVRVLTRNPGKWEPQHRVEVFEGDLAETVDWTNMLHGVDIIVNSAAELSDEKNMYAVNVEGPLRLLQASIQSSVKRWVQLSSVGAYGSIKTGVVNEMTQENPKGPYEVTKTQFDSLLVQHSKSYNIDYCIIRPSNVYGCQMRNNALRHILSALKIGLYTYIGRPGASANYVHVDDVVQALILCLNHPKAANQIYIVSAWETLEIMINNLADGIEVDRPSKRISLRLAILLSRLQFIPRWPLSPSRVHALSNRSKYSTEKIENELGWKLTKPVDTGMLEFSISNKK